MSSFTYRPACEHELARSPAVARIIETYASAATAHAINEAPYRGHVGAHYRDTIGFTIGVDQRGIVGTVLSTDVAAHLIEFGSVHNPPYAPLRRGVERAGLKVTDHHGP